MNKKTLTITFLLILILGLILPFTVKQVKADTEYNWIQNYDFEDGSVFNNLIYDSSFEFGGYGDGVGDWGIVGFGYIETDNPRTLSYCIDIHSSESGGAWQNLTEPTLTDDIETLRLFVDKAGGSTGFSVSVSCSYNDTTSDIFYCEKDSSGYEEFDFADDLTSGKYMYKVTISRDIGHSVTAECWVDDVYIGDFGLGTGQNDIDETTYPWYSPWENFGYDSYIGITTDEHYNGTHSAYQIYPNSPYKNNMYMQESINFLLVDNITSVGCWVMTDSTTNVTIRCTLTFSDWTTEAHHSTNTPFNVTNGWTNLNFTFTTTGKLVIKFVLSVISGDYGDRTYFDMVYLYATSQPTTGQRFTWYTIPDMTHLDYNPLYAWGTIGQNYQFHGIFNDAEGNPTDSGTFTVAHDMGGTSGTVSSGEFSFAIAKRGYSYNGIWEDFNIVLNIDDTGIFEFEISVLWGIDFEDDYYYTTPTPSPYSPYAGVTGDLINWILMFMIIFLPALLFAGGIYENNQKDGAMYISPVFGLIAGLTLSVGLGIFTGLIPMWLLIVIIIAVVLLIVGMIRR